MRFRKSDFDWIDSPAKKRDFIKVALAPVVLPGDPPYTALLTDAAVDNAVCGALWVHGWNACDLADGLQEVRGRAIRAFRMGLKPPPTVQQMKALCARIARNYAVDCLRRQSSERTKGHAGLCDEPDEYTELHLSHEQRDPVDAERQLEVAADLFRQGRMPEHGVEILYNEGTNSAWKDIGADVGISDRAVEGRLKTMRKLFRKAIADRGMG